MLQMRKPKDSDLTLQNFTWIWSKFIVYTEYIYKNLKSEKGKTEKTNTRYNWGIS